ncbi:acyl transferase [Striga asiatica]|uniref:Acyl transferase n=1 Tax=Striga asiatica TaxID=4170 RepID=A0A5A7P475_STRAF|nr:acyl transferase [Striga asiatica]
MWYNGGTESRRGMSRPIDLASTEKLTFGSGSCDEFDLAIGDKKINPGSEWVRCKFLKWGLLMTLYHDLQTNLEVKMDSRGSRRTMLYRQSSVAVQRALANCSVLPLLVSSSSLRAYG